VVVAHDDEFSRVCGGISGRISETALVDLPSLSCRQHVTFSKDTCLLRELGGKNDHEEFRYLLLKDLFEEFPSFPMNIDPKHERNVEPILKVIREYKRERSVVWGNSDQNITNKCYSLAPEIPLIVSLKSMVKLLALFYTGLLPFFPIKETYVEVPIVHLVLARVNGNIGRANWFLRLVGLFMMNKWFFRHLQRRGMQIYAWVLNNDDDYKVAFDFGFDGVMTDYPERLKKFLENKDL